MRCYAERGYENMQIEASIAEQNRANDGAERIMIPVQCALGK